MSIFLPPRQTLIPNFAAMSSVRPGSFRSQKSAFRSPGTDEPESSKMRKPKYSPAVPSPVTTAKEPMIAASPPHLGTEFYEQMHEQMLATHRLLHEGSKNSCAYIYNLYDDTSAPGTKAEEPKIATSPPQGGCVTAYRYPGVADFGGIVYGILGHYNVEDDSNASHHTTPLPLELTLIDPSEFSVRRNHPKHAIRDHPGAEKFH